MWLKQKNCLGLCMVCEKSLQYSLVSDMLCSQLSFVQLIRGLSLPRQIARFLAPPPPSFVHLQPCRNWAHHLRRNGFRGALSQKCMADMAGSSPTFHENHPLRLVPGCASGCATTMPPVTRTAEQRRTWCSADTKSLVTSCKKDMVASFCRSQSLMKSRLHALAKALATQMLPRRSTVPASSVKS